MTHLRLVAVICVGVALLVILAVPLLPGARYVVCDLGGEPCRAIASYESIAYMYGGFGGYVSDLAPYGLREACWHPGVNGPGGYCPGRPYANEFWTFLTLMLLIEFFLLYETFRSRSLKNGEENASANRAGP